MNFSSPTSNSPSNQKKPNQSQQKRMIIEKTFTSSPSHSAIEPSVMISMDMPRCKRKCKAEQLGELLTRYRPAVSHRSIRQFHTDTAGSKGTKTGNMLDINIIRVQGGSRVDEGVNILNRSSAGGNTAIFRGSKRRENRKKMKNIFRKKQNFSKFSSTIPIGNAYLLNLRFLINKKCQNLKKCKITIFVIFSFKIGKIENWVKIGNIDAERVPNGDAKVRDDAPKTTKRRFWIFWRRGDRSSDALSSGNK